MRWRPPEAAAAAAAGRRQEACKGVAAAANKREYNYIMKDGRIAVPARNRQ